MTILYQSKPLYPPAKPQATSSELIQHEIYRYHRHLQLDSDGVSPTEIFGIDRDKMEKILNGLSVNYPEFINCSFTIDL